MRNIWPKIFVVLLYIALTVGLHVMLKNFLFSFYLLPVGLSLLLANILPNYSLPLFTLIIAGELFSAQIPGVITVVTIIPYGMRTIFKNVSPGLSWPSFVLTIVTCALQIGTLLVGNLFTSSRPLSLASAWSQLPVWPYVVAVILTGSVTWGMITLWEEAGLSRRPVGTKSLLLSRRHD